jgi:hypothetical protein
MVAWAVQNFGGLIPKTEARLIPNEMASDALNVDLSGGTLAGLPVLEVVENLSGGSGPTVQRAYRFPGPDEGDADAWLKLPSPFSSAVPSPLANDTEHRIYWTNPDDGAYFSTYDNIIAGVAPYNLGYTEPDSAYTPVVTAAGGTSPTVTPYVDRSYLVTFIDIFGLESSPSPPSADVAGASDGTWTVVIPTTGLPSPTGLNYPAVAGCWLYRTVSGQGTGAQFYRVAYFDYTTSPPPVDGYVDDTLDTDVVNNLELVSAAWNPPLAGMDGLIAYPGGMLIAFTGNTIHFCEPNYPHTWPAEYDISVRYPIQALAVWQGSLVVLTKGTPSTGTGTTPSTFTLQEVQVNEPCISRGSVVTELIGVYYASQNGLVMLSYYGMQNLTVQNFTKNIWLVEYQAADIIACRHRTQYFGLISSGKGFLIEMADQRQGVMPINTQLNATCIWNDPYTGDTYVCADDIIYRWDSQNTGPGAYRWTSKDFYLEAPVSLGAVQVSADASIAESLPALPTFDNPDASLALPEGINATFTMYAGGYPVMTTNLTGTRDIFRLPSGFKAFNYSFEIVARVPIFSVQLASTMKELVTV